MPWKRLKGAFFLQVKREESAVVIGYFRYRLWYNRRVGLRSSSRYT